MGCTCDKVQKKQSKIGNFPIEDSSTRPKPLTDTQKAVIKNNWQILKLHIANVGVITFVSMFETKPDLKEAFANFRGKDITELSKSGLIRAHALRVMATVDKCVTRIDTPASMIKLCQELGQSHKQYNLKPEYMQEMLMPFLSAIKPHLEDCWCPETESTWRLLMVTILHYIREGMTQPTPDKQGKEKSNSRGDVFTNKHEKIAKSPLSSKHGLHGEQTG